MLRPPSSSEEERSAPASRPVDVVWNPCAGNREQNAAALEQLLQDPAFHIHCTDCEANTAERTADLLAGGSRQIAACGGDGVINLVADTILKSGLPATLGVLPMGTGNDYARSLGLPLSALEAAPLLSAGASRPLDVFRLSGPGLDRFGMNMLAGGNTGQYTRHLTDEIKQQWGPFCFLRGAVEVLQNLEVYPVRLRCDDGEWESFDLLNLFVANGRCAGAGLPVAPDAWLDDGLLDLVVVLDGSAIQLADLALQYMLADHREHELIVSRRVRSLEIESGVPLAWAVDGQEFSAANLTVSLVPQALSVVIGPLDPAVSPP